MLKSLTVLSLFLISVPAFAQDAVLVTAFRATPVAFAPLGAEAADVLATSLPATNMAVPKTMVMQELALRGWREPLTGDQLIELSKAFGAKAFVRGGLMVTFPRGRQRTAKIELALELVDSATGSAVGGDSPLPVIVKLSGDANQESEFLSQTVRELVTRSAPKLSRASLASGRVLVIEQSGEIHLNIGQRQGLQPGNRVAVSRRVSNGGGPTKTMRVGELIVKSATELSAIARASERQTEVQQLDNVTQVFEIKASKALVELMRG